MSRPIDQSFRGAREASEPGIQPDRADIWIPGSRPNGAAPRNDEEKTHA